VLSKLRRSVHKRDNLDSAWRVIQRNGQYSTSDDVRQAIEQFAQNPSKHISSLQRKLSRGSFEFGQARGAPIQKLDGKGKPTGKIRPIVIGTLESRIVQRAILNVLLEIPKLKPHIVTPYSFGGLRRPATKGDGEELIYSAVPAAIKAVVDEIGNGAVAAADITAFFTRIPKSTVLDIVREAVDDDDLMLLVEKAVAVELANLAELRSLADQFPIEDIGVAQGNSLSPLLGNIILASFDKTMNAGDCRCIRYIDDFIILAPTKKAANAKLKLAISLLENLGMTLSPEKSSKAAQPLANGIEFLGIEIVPGLVRPAKKARSKFLTSVRLSLDASISAIAAMKQGKALDNKLALVATLKRVDGTIQGWGKHYWFCNDWQVFSAIDDKIKAEVARYLGAYTSIRMELPVDKQHLPLGLSSLSFFERSPFQYPKLTD
jgi:retron-type reverse transcriptase